jgi:integral membrane sensor domain MASE1
MNQQTDILDSDSKVQLPLFKLSDLFWLAAIGAVMASSGVWQWLSPRPEIGQVAVLWLPNALIFVAIFRNWERWLFCLLACLVFLSIGLIPAFDDNSLQSAILLLSVDLIEVSILVGILVAWLGRNFRLSSALNIAVFSVACAVACAIGGTLAATVSQLSIGAIAVTSKAPLQVGVAWFTSDLATYFLAAAPLMIVTGRGRTRIWADIKGSPVSFALNVVFVMGLTFIGFALPQWLAKTTGLALGSGGLILIAFPLATYIAFTRGAGGAALTAAAIGIPAIYATMAGIGPFGVGNASEDVFNMQATLIVCTVTLLLIGAMADGMRGRTAALERALDEAIKMRQARQ